MKSRIAIILTVMCTLCATSAFAKEYRVGVINVVDIMKSAPQALKMRNKITDEFKPRQEKLVSAQKKLKANQDKLSRDAAVLSASQKTQIEENIQRQTRDLQRDQQTFMQDLQFAQKKAMHDLTQKLNKIVEQLAKKQHFDLIMQRDQVVFASTTIDITPQVVLELKKPENNK